MSLSLRSIVVLLLVTANAVCVVPTGGKIQGKVKEENGKSLTGVTITAKRSVTRSLDNEDGAGQQTFTAKTDDKGEFSLTELPVGIYTLTFALKGFRTGSSRRYEIAEGETLKFSKAFELPREKIPNALIRGAVLDESGYSLPNASVALERIDGGKFKKQEKNSVIGGEFGFSVPAEKATYRITASADGFVTASKEITIDGDEIRQVTLQLVKKS